MAHQRNKYRLQPITEEMTVKYPLAAGVDVGSRQHAAAIPSHLTPEFYRLFGCTTPELLAMAAWLLSFGITTVAMESTGNYWVQPMRILQAAGLHVILVHPEYARQAKRTKYSDLDDSVWLQQMHAYGLLPASFLPEPTFQRLRSLWRHRANLIADQGRCIQRMQNALELMNLQVHKAISDLAGKTGMLIIRALVRGERNPAHLAQFRDPRCKCTPTELTDALTGDYREEELFVLGQVLAQYDLFGQQVEQLDAQIEVFLQEQVALAPPLPEDPPFPNVSRKAKGAVTPDTVPQPAAPASQGKPNVQAAGMPRKRRSTNEPTAYDWHAALHRLLGVDATRICGLSVMHVMSLIAELGVSMRPWETGKRFTAWLGLAPDHRVSGGKVLKRRTRKGKPYAAHFFYQAALAVAKSETPLGEFYRYHKGRLGPAKALTATARKIALLYYFLLTYGPEFVERGIRHVEQQNLKRKRKRLKQLAQELGVTILENVAA